MEVENSFVEIKEIICYSQNKEGCVNTMFPLTNYIEHAMAAAHYDKLDDGTFAGRIPKCKGVVAMAKTLRECEEDLRSVLEEWVLLGLKLGHPNSVGIDFSHFHKCYN